jgi:hypothetical protein
MTTMSIPVSRLFLRPDARRLDSEAVKRLASSIAEIGVLNPLRVRPVQRNVEGSPADAYEVTAGAHRLQASIDLGLDEIPCTVVSDDDLHAELAMIDENLMRAELSPADRARQTARRKEIYVVLYPATAAHVAGAHAANAAMGNASANLAPAFTCATAEATGRSERAIQRDAERGEKVCDKALDLIRGTALDTGSYLDKLKAVATDEQVATVQRALAGLARQEERERAEKTQRAAAKETDRAIALTEAEQFAGWIMQRTDLSELPTIISWLEGTKAKDVISAMRRAAA